MEVKEQVFSAISEALNISVNEIKETEKLYDSLGVDSTEMVELNLALEKKFGIKLLKDEITKNSTPQEIVEIVKEKLEHNENS